jgi:hypothetical protein
MNYMAQTECVLSEIDKRIPDSGEKQQWHVQDS